MRTKLSAAECIYIYKNSSAGDWRMSTVENIDAELEAIYNRIENKEEQSSISHEELVKLTKEAIKNLIETDPLLQDLPTDPTVEEIRAQIAVAQGQAIILYLDRGPLPRLSIVVPARNTSVLDLKKAVKRHTTLALKREHVKRKISWKHVWKKYYLCFEDIKLTDDTENIKNYGMKSKSVLHYVKRRREKNTFR